jgi:hypothetical protein
VFLTHDRRKDILLGLALLLLPVAFFPELIFAGKALIRSDLNWIHYPLRVLIARNWLAGNWPLWNPYVLCGEPLLAEAQVAALYPLNALFVLPIPTHIALSLFTVLHVGMAALFTYFLGRTLGLGRAGALLAGLAFGLGGVTTAQITQLNIMIGLVWMPLVLGLTIKATERRSIGWVLVGGLALALQFLGSHPQAFFYTILLIVVYALYRTVSSIRSSGWTLAMFRPALTVALIGALGSGLAAVQLLPTMELWRASVRSGGVSFDQLTLYSMHPLQLAEFLIPNLFGNPVVTYQGLGDFCEYHAYVGLLPLFLAVATWRRRNNPHVRFFFLALMGALLLSLGSYVPFYSVLQHVPGFQLFRIPARWIALISLAVAVLAGFGLDELSKQDRSRATTRTLLWVMGAVGLLALAAAVFIWLRRLQAEAGLAGAGLTRESDRLLGAALQRFLLPGTPDAANWLPNLVPWTTIPGLVLLIELPVAGGLLVGCARGKLRPASLSYALIGLTLLDLLVTEGAAVTQLGDASYWRHDNAVIELVRTAAGTSRADVLGTQASHKIDPQNALEPAHRAIYWLMRYNPVMYNIASPTGYFSPLRLERFEGFNRDVPIRRAEDMMSEKIVLTWGEPTRDQKTYLHEIYSADMLHVYENPDALPRAYLAYHVEEVPDAQAALLRLTKSDYDPARSTVVEGPLPVVSLPGAGISPADIRLYSAQRVVVDCDSAQDAALVLTDSYYPGWRAFVDGKEAPILHGNYLFRAVPVTRGRHTVEFVYSPDSFKIGLLVSGATMLAMLLAVAFTIRRRRKSTGPLDRMGPEKRDRSSSANM